MTVDGQTDGGRSRSVIEVRGGSFGYRGTSVVIADLTIGHGEVVALLGPNGSGKTTLMKGMLGLVDRLAGEVELFGRPLERFGERRLLGYVPQRQSAAGPIPVTVEELVRSGRLAGNGLLSPSPVGRHDGDRVGDRRRRSR